MPVSLVYLFNTYIISHSTEVLSWNKVLTLELPACINEL